MMGRGHHTRTVQREAHTDGRAILNAEAAYALLARGTQGFTMFLAALCVAWTFSLNQQGIFFVFLSFGALIQLAEFGLSYAVLQTASHLASSNALARLDSLRHQAHHIGRWLSATATVLVGGVGVMVFAAGSAVDGDVPGWLGPWLGFVIAVAGAQYMQWQVAMIEGARSARLAWRLRLLQESLGGIAFVAGLLSGAMLWSLCVYWGVRATVAAMWLSLDHRRERTALERDPERLDWRREVWPFQWRIGLSSLSGFLIFQAFNPILLVAQGSAAAATFGMSLAIMNMLLLLTTAWPLSQASHFGALLARGDFPQMRQQLRRTLLGSTALTALIAVAVILAMYWMKRNNVTLVNRLADIPTTAALLSAAIVHHIAACLAVVLRAERRDPLLRVSVFGGILTVCVVWFAARLGRPLDVAAANLVCTLPGLIVAMQHYRRFARRTLAASHEASIPVGD